jgi:hypothetical protein
LIAFATDEVCRRCGSDKLFEYSAPDQLPETTANSKKILSVWYLLACFIFSCVFEFVTIYPILANLGWNHSSAGHTESSNLEKIYVFVIFISHIPSFVVSGLLSLVVGDLGFFLIPFVQIIVWMLLLTFLWKIIENKLR